MKTQPYTVRRSRRAKNLILHVNEECQVEVVIPWHVARREVESFVREKQTWLEKTVARLKIQEAKRPKRRLQTGEWLPLLGENYHLRVVADSLRKRSSWAEEDGELSIFIKQREKARRVVESWYRKRAQIFFTKEVTAMAQRLGVKPGKVVVSNARSQWGSCQVESGRISLNWRLLLGPEKVAQYVVAHEVAHLKERKHTKNFWQQVERLVPDYKQLVTWLKQNAIALQL